MYQTESPNNFQTLWVLKAYWHLDAVRKLVLIILPKKLGQQHLYMLNAFNHCLVTLLCTVKNKEVQRCQEAAVPALGLCRGCMDLPDMEEPCLLYHAMPCCHTGHMHPPVAWFWIALDYSLTNTKPFCTSFKLCKGTWGDLSALVCGFTPRCSGISLLIPTDVLLDRV